MDTTLGIYPVVDRGRWDARIQGPDNGGPELTWLIDGHMDGMQEGAIYKITFRWTDRGAAWKSIGWEPTEEMLPSLQHFGLPKTVYSIAGSWSKFAPRAMEQDGLDPGHWRTTITIGGSGEEQFHFARNGKQSELISPAEPKATDTAI